MKKKSYWVVGEPVRSTQPVGHLRERPIVSWRPLPSTQSPTRMGAMRSYMEGLNPEILGFPDELIRRHWRPWARLRYAKLLHVIVGEDDPRISKEEG